MEDECEVYIRNLGGCLVLIFIRADILVCVMAVVVVGVMFFRKRVLSVTEVECLGVSFGLVGGGIFNLSGGFVVLVVEVRLEDLELVVKAVVRLIWGCLSGMMYFLWRLSLMSVQGEISNVGGSLFGMVMRTNFLRLLFFLESVV